MLAGGLHTGPQQASNIIYRVDVMILVALGMALKTKYRARRHA
jgi:hypothetical protein